VSAEERVVVVVREVGAGAALVFVAEFIGAALSAGSITDALLVGLASGMAATLADDWMSRAFVGALAAATLAAFTSYRLGSPAWSYTPIIGLAVMVGAGYRTLRRLEAAGD
jgi:hypothetical protein